MIEKPNPVMQITTETTTVIKSFTDEYGCETKETTQKISNRVNLENIEEHLIREYLGLDVKISWPDSISESLPPEEL